MGQEDRGDAVFLRLREGLGLTWMATQSWMLSEFVEFFHLKRLPHSVLNSTLLHSNKNGNDSPEIIVYVIICRTFLKNCKPAVQP